MPRAIHLTLALLWLAATASAGELLLVFTNDVHGRHEPRNLMGSRRAGGAPALAAALAKLRGELREDQALLLVDTGDFLYGEGRAAEHRGAPAIRVMNALGYDAAALGNHEFDLGWGTLAARAREARFPFLSANVYRRDQVAPPGVHPSKLILVDRLGLRVGLVGITLEDAASTGPFSRNRGLRFGDAAAALTREVDRLRGQGADRIVVLSHQGLRADRDMLRAAPPGAIDLVLGGHHPRDRVDLNFGDTRILQGAGEGIEFGVVRLRDDASATSAPVEWRPWARLPAPRGPLDELLEPFRTPEPVLAEAPARWSRDRTGRWMLESMAAAARARGLEPDVTMVNRGTLRASMSQGPVTPSSLRRIAPFDNHLVELRMSARRLRRILAEGSARKGRRGLMVLGEPPNRGTASVLVNDYLAEGGDGYELLGRTFRRKVLACTVRDAMAQSLPEALEAPEPAP